MQWKLYNSFRFSVCDACDSESAKILEHPGSFLKLDSFDVAFVFIHAEDDNGVVSYLSSLVTE